MAKAVESKSQETKEFTPQLKADLGASSRVSSGLWMAKAAESKSQSRGLIITSCRLVIKVAAIACSDGRIF